MCEEKGRLLFRGQGVPDLMCHFAASEIEAGTVSSVQSRDGVVVSFSVDFAETGDFDEFPGDTLGEFFLLREVAVATTLLCCECAQ